MMSVLETNIIGDSLMNSNINNQSDNGGNEKELSSSRGTADKGNLNQSGQSGTLGSEQRQSNDLAGGMPKSPGTKNLSADEDMDDDTGLSNRVNNRQASDIDEGSRQSEQSNVGRRSDGTPD
jgi:hypothetical protein